MNRRSFFARAAACVLGLIGIAPAAKAVERKYGYVGPPMVGWYHWRCIDLDTGENIPANWANDVTGEYGITVYADGSPVIGHPEKSQIFRVINGRALIYTRVDVRRDCRFKLVPPERKA